MSNIGSSQTRNVAVSFTIPAAFLVGGGVIPGMIGMLSENGYFPAGFVVTGILILSGAILPGFLKFSSQEGGYPDESG